MFRVTFATMFLLASAGCGGDEGSTPFSTQTGRVGSGQHGVVPGHFLLRLQPNLVVDLEELRQAIVDMFPNTSVRLERRFANVDPTVGSTKVSFERLLKVEISPWSVENNLQLYLALRGLVNSAGETYFARVDPDKFLLRSTYDIVAINDPSFQDDSQYYLDMIRWREGMEDIQPEELARAETVVAAVFDTGVDADHEDLQGVLWQDPEDHGHNGFNVFTGKSEAARDLHGHGTAVAGIIDARGGNGIGIHGAAFLDAATDGRSVTEIMSLTVLDKDGGGTSDGIGRAVYWAVSRHAAQRQQPGRENQKLILNLSLAGPFDTQGYDYELDGAGAPVFEDEMLTYARENDVLIVAAAGNESCTIGGACGIDGEDFAQTYYYPCSYQGVLCVAASTHEDRLAGMSNRGDSVGIVAPGWGIYTTASKGTQRGYGYFSGTSEATPLVASVAALVWSLYPQFSASDVEAVLTKSSARIAPIQAELSSGNGRLDLFAALRYARQLTEAGVSPSALDPELIASTEIVPGRAPELSGDPYGTSVEAFGAAGPPAASSGDQKSLLGCGVTGAPSRASGLGLLLLLLGPLACCVASVQKMRAPLKEAPPTL